MINVEIYRITPLKGEINMDENKEMTLVEKVEAEAKDGFRNGLNCSECVMTAFLNNFETMLEKELLLIFCLL